MPDVNDQYEWWKYHINKKIDELKDKYLSPLQSSGEQQYGIINEMPMHPGRHGWDIDEDDKPVKPLDRKERSDLSAAMGRSFATRMMQKGKAKKNEIRHNNLQDVEMRAHKY